MEFPYLLVQHSEGFIIHLLIGVRVERVILVANLDRRCSFQDTAADRTGSTYRQVARQQVFKQEQDKPDFAGPWIPQFQSNFYLAPIDRFFIKQSAIDDTAGKPVYPDSVWAQPLTIGNGLLRYPQPRCVRLKVRVRGARQTRSKQVVNPFLGIVFAIPHDPGDAQRSRPQHPGQACSRKNGFVAREQVRHVGIRRPGSGTADEETRI